MPLEPPKGARKGMVSLYAAKRRAEVKFSTLLVAGVKPQAAGASMIEDLKIVTNGFYISMARMPHHWHPDYRRKK